MMKNINIPVVDTLSKHQNVLNTGDCTCIGGIAMKQNLLPTW